MSAAGQPGRVRLLVVDGANVVGSRPDGWWRDRPGAAARLVDRIIDAVGSGALAPPVTVVLEGAARRGRAEGRESGVTVVHAAGSGDDTIVGVVADVETAATVVTADRELRARCVARGATCEGPSWLLDRLP